MWGCSNYIVFSNNDARRLARRSYRHLEMTDSDPYEKSRVRAWDQMLHRALSELFQKRRLTSEQIRKLLLRSPSKKHTDEDPSIFDLLLAEEPALRKLYLKKSKLPLLWIVVLSCYQESAELLVRSGADVNQVYGTVSSRRLSKKSTLLHALTQTYPSAWNERFYAFLIDNGADLKARNSETFTALHSAVHYNRVKLAGILLEKGANPTAAGHEGLTPLFEAARSPNAEELLPLLIKHGADLTTKDVYAGNVLRYLTTAPYEHVDLARDLIQRGVSPEEVFSNQLQPVHLAAYKSRIGLLNLFLDHGANVNARREIAGESALYFAARHSRNPAVVLTLLKRGANIDSKLNSGDTALHAFGYPDDTLRGGKGAARVMKVLLDYDADMFAEDNEGSTPFEVVRRVDTKHPCLQLMIKKLALKKVASLDSEPTVEVMKSEDWISKHPELWTRYQACLEELDRIKSTKIVRTGAIIELLTKCQCQLLELMRYREFRAFCIPKKTFPIYCEDIVEVFQGVERYYDAVMSLESYIGEAFYHRLTEDFVEKVAALTMVCEVCQVKKIVKASRAT